MSARPASRAPRELRRPAQDTRRASLPPRTARQQIPGAGSHNGFDPRTRFLDSTREQRRQIRLLPGNHVGNRPLGPLAGVGFQPSHAPVYTYSPAMTSSSHIHRNGQYYSSQPTQWYGNQLTQDNFSATPDQDAWLNEPVSSGTQPPRFTTPADEFPGQAAILDPEISRRKISRPVSHSTATAFEISKYNERLADIDDKPFEDHDDKDVVHDTQDGHSTEIPEPTKAKRKTTPNTADGEPKKKKLAIYSNEQLYDKPTSTGDCACHGKSKPSISVKDFTVRLRDINSAFAQHFTTLASTNDTTNIIHNLEDAVDHKLQPSDYEIVERITHGIFLGNVLGSKSWEMWKPMFGGEDVEVTFKGCQ
ncbi:hypothetical protein PFICI_14359 [Pestalotiopsis fici W106-1]|uniref:Uncharacterized protein n=1 Tax=Pestalotiopsis fici (strain W106-1 / CGMCC3.15140) TaxID=1229662 RepID=W3WKS6_PESFW|nr:uncharacterized protein PFICI_14359 [Pestalotiopsis fici W106-1]ETS74493.1 hypothetical protein PFICI_14359 [Pestalotiopsis fici W106-1]